MCRCSLNINPIKTGQREISGVTVIKQQDITTTKQVPHIKMSLIDEPSQETDQKDAEIHSDAQLEPEDVQVKDFLQTSETNRRTISPLTLIKEDLTQFKEEVLKVFKDKDAKTTSQSAEKSVNTLTLLREDLHQLKDDLSSVFRMGLSKERDTAKEDSFTNSFKIKAPDEPLKTLLRKDRNLLQTPQRAEEPKETPSENSEEQTDDAFRGNFSDEPADAEKTNMKDNVNELEDGELDEKVSEEKAETMESEEMASKTASLPAADQRCESEEWSGDSSEASEDEDGPSESLPWEPLSSGIALFSLRDDLRDQPEGELWSLKNFACYLTLDPNTANSELRLTECNRRASRLWLGHRSSDHPERFENCPQVLCREGLLDSVYWEVEWSGGADVGVAYNSISRDGDVASCLLGHNEQSWSLECSEGSYTPCHNRKRFKSSSPEPFTRRVGVYLNWSAGSLSFYCVSQDAMVHLHTFTSAFTEPLYPAFWVWGYNGSVSLCQVELGWERLLQ
ncbi:E3 ubiquitin/ISG15 ligase TRIM25-like [Stegastes partitus]|uniref:E3 ubiquitin/ISG15 ligase TRIM25-like n=1 Tax=Stegastes partitus TaxID=144197 RepID=A0A3B5B8K6_9TELE|nr:PREDICTED: E3 ubiquitin/ISG15 ligase TRIM25-like [Stegastes partitus]